MGAVPIGTGEAVTPVQVLDAYNAVANDGMFVPPRLVQATVSPSGAETPARYAAPHRVLDASTARQIVPMLEEVTAAGTGLEAEIPGYTVAGKTGTAQIPGPNGQYTNGWMATFVGFVPAQQPRLTAIVVLNRPDVIYGGSASAPVFSTIMRYALRHFDISPPATRRASQLSWALVTAGEPATKRRAPLMSSDEPVRLEAVIERLGRPEVIGDPAVSSSTTCNTTTGECSLALPDEPGGDLFCCVPGDRSDGHAFAAAARRRGAVAFLCERPPRRGCRRCPAAARRPARGASRHGRGRLCRPPRPGITAAGGRDHRNRRQDDDHLPARQYPRGGGPEHGGHRYAHGRPHDAGGSRPAAAAFGGRHGRAGGGGDGGHVACASCSIAWTVTATTSPCSPI